jgi:serine/threonine protein kinase
LSEPIATGTLLAPGFAVVDHLHRTSVYDVYDVWSEERACRCVAKLLHPDRADSETDRRRLRREGRLLARLSHPHIVRVYETLDQPQPILILETLPGATLGRVIRDRGRLGAADLVLLGLHLASAMHYLHRQGYLHLDLKPSNVIVHAGLAKVIDFSIARPIGDARRGVGTRQYLSPEQARGDALTPAADVWGIGAVLFEAATGRTPFENYGADRRYEQLERSAVPIRLRRRLPKSLAAALDGCLHPDPAGRPAVDELLQSLSRLI